MTNHLGTVYLVGAGAGSYEYITLKGARLLAQADIVFADALLDTHLKTLIGANTRWIDVGKRGYRASASQNDIDCQLLEAAKNHTTVVRLKGGDPSLYARSEEELAFLHAHGVSTEVVPGITAALAAAASTQRPLTRRGAGRSVALVTASTKPSNAYSEVALPNADTLVFYMVGQQMAITAQRLIRQGWSKNTPTLVVSRAGYTDAKASEHVLCDLVQPILLHAGRPTVVTIGLGANRVKPARHFSDTEDVLSIAPEVEQHSKLVALS